MSCQPSFTEFASSISENAKIIEEFLTSNGIPRPSFTPNGPIGFPVPADVTHIHQARESLLDAARRLYYLALGPVESLLELSVRVGVGR